MTYCFKLLSCTAIATILFPATLSADVVLTFDQTGVANSSPINQDYGDRVTATSDAVGSYGTAVGTGELFTPNVEVSYTAGQPRLWISGYSELTNVFYNELDGDDSFEVSFAADAGFKVGVFDFDIGAFGSTQTLPGIQIIDGDSNLLWSVGSTAIDGATSTNFDTGGIFADSLTIAVDLTGLGGASDNFGIDNIRFAQTTAVPEPTSCCLLIAGLMSLAARRKRRDA